MLYIVTCSLRETFEIDNGSPAVVFDQAMRLDTLHSHVLLYLLNLMYRDNSCSRGKKHTGMDILKQILDQIQAGGEGVKS